MVVFYSKASCRSVGNKRFDFLVECLTIEIKRNSTEEKWQFVLVAIMTNHVRVVKARREESRRSSRESESFSLQAEAARRPAAILLFASFFCNQCSTAELASSITSQRSDISFLIAS